MIVLYGSNLYEPETTLKLTKNLQLIWCLYNATSRRREEAFLKSGETMWGATWTYFPVLRLPGLNLKLRKQCYSNSHIKSKLNIFMSKLKCSQVKKFVLFNVHGKESPFFFLCRAFLVFLIWLNSCLNHVSFSAFVTIFSEMELLLYVLILYCCFMYTAFISRNLKISDLSSDRV